MTTAGAEELSEILERVKDWSPPSRITLARRILESLDPSADSETMPGLPTETTTRGVPPIRVVERTREPSGSPTEASTRGVPVEAIIGLLRTDREPPDDEECRRIIEEERWKKYGS